MVLTNLDRSNFEQVTVAEKHTDEPISIYPLNTTLCWLVAILKQVLKCIERLFPALGYKWVLVRT